MNRKEFINRAGVMTLGTSLLPMLGYSKNDVGQSIWQEINTPKSDYDVIIIGGSYAGLATALTSVRSLRNVLLIDTGKPRNRFAEKAYNGILLDGLKPAEVQKVTTEQLSPYQSYLDRLNDEAIDVRKQDNGFTVTTKNSGESNASFLVFATGATDELPDITGIADQWGKNVHHCPYCHGFESRKGKTLLLSNNFQGLELLGSLQHWSEQLTVALQTEIDIPAQLEDFMEKQSIKWTKQKVVEVRSRKDGTLKEIVYEDGRTEDVDHIYVKPKTSYQTHLAEKLGCEIDDSRRLATDDFMLTSQPGIYAVGDISARSMGQIIWAANSGMMAGVHINNQMIANSIKK